MKLSNISESLFIDFLSALSFCISYLERDSENEVFLFLISMPELLAELHHKCLSLNTPVLRNMKFAQVRADVVYMDFNLSSECNETLICSAKSKLGQTVSMIFQ